MQNLNKLFHLNIYAFIMSLHLSIIVYVESTFLSGIFGQENIWIIYSVAAFCALLLNFSISPILKIIPIRHINIFALSIAFMNVLLLFFYNNPLYIFISYLIFMIFSQYLFMLSSVMIEDLSKDSVTGGVRGRFISMQSLAYLLGPFLSAFVIKYFGLSYIFLFSSFFVLFSLIYFQRNIKSLSPITIHGRNFKTAFSKIFKNYDIRTAIFSLVTMNIFYIASTVYIPFKMESLGISLTAYLSVLLPVALLPFLFIPTALGHFEDKMKDEKQFIIFGLIGLVLSLVAFALVNSSSIIVWAIILFISRVFASILETSINSYFFKKVDKSDTTIISIFSSSSPIAYLLFSPVLALLLAFGNLQTVFLSISFFICFVLVLVSKIHNTEHYEKHKNWLKIWEKSRART